MDLNTLESLIASQGQAALRAAADLAPSEATYLTHITHLRKHFPANLAQAALETVLLRAKAKVKFANADAMLFTKESLEMASGEAVSNHRARRFANYTTVADLGCGIGADTLGLANAGCLVEAVENDPVRLRMAEFNLAANGLSAGVRFHNLDLLNDPLPEAKAAFADPGRRSEGKRFLSLKDYLPPPGEIRKRFPEGFPLAFKLAPGVNLDELQEFDGEIEFVSAGGELKECIVWLGEFGERGRRATMLSNPLAPRAVENEDRSRSERITPVHTHFASVPKDPGEPGKIGAVLYDPNAAVVRSGLVPNLGEQLSAWPADAIVQMLSADSNVETPFATAYRVEVVLPFDSRTVQAWLKSHGIGRVTILKRGATADAAAVAEKWKLKGSDHRYVIVTRELGKQVAVIGSSLY